MLSNELTCEIGDRVYIEDANVTGVVIAVLENNEFILELDEPYEGFRQVTFRATSMFSYSVS